MRHAVLLVTLLRRHEPHTAHMLERQVYVLRVWRDAQGNFHASLKAETCTWHFANLEQLIVFVKSQFSTAWPQPHPED